MSIPHEAPIVTVPVATPFDSAEKVDHEALAYNVEKWQSTPLGGFIVGSATGEEWFLSEAEKLEIARTVQQELDKRRFLIGGIDCPSVVETLRRAEAFASMGAELVRVRIPRDELTAQAYFEQLLPRCPVPVLVMHQCNPERFGHAGTPAAMPEVIGRICSIDNVFGYVTDHDVRFEAQVRRLIPADRRFWICNGSLILSGTLIGCNGTTTAFANIWPEALHELLQLGMSGRYEEARPLQEKVQRIDAAMLRYGATGVKTALNLLGYRVGSRSPLRPMPPEAVAILEAEMRAASLL